MDIKELITAVPQAEKIINKTPTMSPSTNPSGSVRDRSSNKDLNEGELIRERARLSSGE